MGNSLSENCAGGVLRWLRVGRGGVPQRLASASRPRPQCAGRGCGERPRCTPVILWETRKSASRWSRWPADIRRFVPGRIGGLFKRHGMSFKTTACASEREAGRGRPPGGLVRDVAGTGSQAAGVRRMDRRFDQDGPVMPPHLTGRAMPSAHPHRHRPITSCTGALRLHGMIVPVPLNRLMNGGKPLAYVEQSLAVEAAAR